MKGSSTWNYSPYKPFLFNTGGVYICRIAPSANKIHVEWLSLGEAEYSVFARERGEGDFSLCGTTQACEFDITGVEEGKDYELFVCAGDKKSRVRLAKCADAVGTVKLDGAYRVVKSLLGNTVATVEGDVLTVTVPARESAVLRLEK